VRKTFSLLLALVLSATPSLSFAFNANSFGTAKSCCDNMNGSCGNAADPQSCCGTSVVRVEKNATVTAPPHLEFATVVEIVTLRQKFGAISMVANSVTGNESPPGQPSPPLILRI
jgi:hypothetical protein